MKQLVYGGILMITGMLGVIADILTLSASIADNASIMFLIAFAGIILFAIMVFLGYYEHVIADDASKFRLRRHYFIDCRRRIPFIFRRG